jgi:hypothetical protein
LFRAADRKLLIVQERVSAALQSEPRGVFGSGAISLLFTLEVLMRVYYYPLLPICWNHGVRGNLPTKIYSAKDLFFKIFRNNDLAENPTIFGILEGFYVR